MDYWPHQITGAMPKGLSLEIALTVTEPPLGHFAYYWLCSYQIGNVVDPYGF